MAISVNWPTGVITVPQADCTFISGTLYELDTDWFRLQLRALEDDAEGMGFPRTHIHNTEVVVAGQTYARTIEIVNGYSVQFTPDSQWSVILKNSNNNIWDVENGILVQNQVQVIPTNSAGLISSVVETGTSGLTASESAMLSGIFKSLLNRHVLVEGDTNNFVIYDDADLTPLYTLRVTDKDGNAIIIPAGAPAERSRAT